MEAQLNSLTFGKAILIGIVLGAIYYSAIYDNGAGIDKQIEAAKTEVEKSKGEIDVIKKAIADAERYQQTMNVLGVEMDRVLRAVPAEFSSTDLMRAISNEGKSVGLQINQVRVSSTLRYANAGKGAERPIVEPLIVEGEFTGTYNQVMKFLSNLTRLDKIVAIHKLSFETKESGTTVAISPSVFVKGEFRAYRYVGNIEPEPKKGPAKPAPKAKEG